MTESAFISVIDKPESEVRNPKSEAQSLESNSKIWVLSHKSEISDSGYYYNHMGQPSPTTNKYES